MGFHGASAFPSERNSSGSVETPRSWLVTVITFLVSIGCLAVYLTCIRCYEWWKRRRSYESLKDEPRTDQPKEDIQSSYGLATYQSVEELPHPQPALDRKTEISTGSRVPYIPSTPPSDDEDLVSSGEETNRALNLTGSVESIDRVIPEGARAEPETIWDLPKTKDAKAQLECLLPETRDATMSMTLTPETASGTSSSEAESLSTGSRDTTTTTTSMGSVCSETEVSTPSSRTLSFETEDATRLSNERVSPESMGATVSEIPLVTHALLKEQLLDPAITSEISSSESDYVSSETEGLSTSPELIASETEGPRISPETKRVVTELKDATTEAKGIILEAKDATIEADVTVPELKGATIEADVTVSELKGATIEADVTVPEQKDATSGTEAEVTILEPKDALTEAKVNVTEPKDSLVETLSSGSEYASCGSDGITTSSDSVTSEAEGAKTIPETKG